MTSIRRLNLIAALTKGRVSGVRISNIPIIRAHVVLDNRKKRVKIVA